MKINYIKLKNFASIVTSFKTEEISIDFTQSKNKIILVTGPNGSGKTSILSCLHPFATNGNLDERSDSPIIKEGSEGYKEIHIQDENNIYVIKHYYSPKDKSHTIKSFIEKNGSELNPNGNVTSFKDIVSDELDIEMDYLKLARLGSNVTGFIDLKPTDRKAFMGKLLDELDIYMKYYKKLTNDLREIKSIISHTTDKLSKLGISDIDDMEKNQEKLHESIDKIKGKIEDVTSSLAIIDHDIKLICDSPTLLKEKLEDKIKEMNKVFKSIEKISNKGFSGEFNKEDEELLNECKSKITDLIKKDAFLDSELISLSEKRSSLLQTIDKSIQELSDIDKEISKSESSSDITDEEEIIKGIKERIANRAKECNLVGFEPNYTRKEMEDLLLMVERCMELLLTTYEFGIGPINKALDFIESNEDINKYIQSNQEKNSKNKLQAMSEYVVSELNKKFKQVKPECKVPSECKVYQFYEELMDVATEVPDIVVEDETFITYTKMAYQNISAVIKNIQDEKECFNRMPDVIKDMFKYSTITSHIRRLEKICDKSVFYNELSLITDYELQESDLKELQDHKEKLKLIKKSIGNIDFLVKRKEVLTQEIEDNKSSLEDISNTYRTKYNESVDTKKLLTDLNEFIESVEIRDQIVSEVNSLKSSLEKVKELSLEKKRLLESYDHIIFEHNRLNKEYNENNYKIQTYKSLSKDLKKYSKDFDDVDLIKSALSSKEGIPLLFIEVYFKDIQDITNELLEIIYDDDLYIEDFDITSDEFGIPFVTKNTRIKDAKYASQGEKSFLSLALSFALIYKSISRYNIMLLDEIDSTLDTTNREKFLKILEKQMDMIESEQIFLISHNNMFNMYPVDIINTKNEINEDNKLANYITIKI